MSLRRPPEQRKNIRRRHSQLHPAQCLGYLLWCPDPYRTVNIVDLTVRGGDVLRPRLSPLIEEVTDAAVFDRAPTEPTLDAAGSGGHGGLRPAGHGGNHHLPRRERPTATRRRRDAALAYDTTTTQPAVFVNVSAQGDSNSIGCRIKIDNAVKDERSANTLNAFTYCLDKSG
jgi:hypothetical protein